MSIEALRKDKTGIIIAILVTFFLWTFASSKFQSVIIENTPIGIKNAVIGEPFEICRRVTYLKDTTVKMNRSIFRNTETGEMITVDLPEISFSRTAGSKTICRNIIIPHYLEDGMWTIRTFITTNSFPFWTTTFEIPEIEINAIRKQLHE